MISDSSCLNVLLGPDDIQILTAIKYGLSDITSINAMTGVPVPCIERRMHAYLELEFVKETKRGYVFNAENEPLITCLSSRAAHA